jgi:NAD(P)-dependent dehydrogenase (short-subunit alcohol dehydrogenase family)
MKTIIITGAGSGMGEATAKLLSADSNNSLVLIGRSQEKLNRVWYELENKSSHKFLAVDICNANDLKEGLSEVLGSRSLECVFANAGIGGENNYGEGDRWHEIIQTNLTGTYNTIMESLPYLRNSKDKFKHIVITSSCLARFGVPNYTAYCTAKTGLLGLTRSVAVQYAQEGILVNALTPGWVRTEMAERGIQLLADRAGITFDESFKQQMGFVPTGNISEPNEIAELVAFLFSGKQNSITGQALDINNGSYMQ